MHGALTYAQVVLNLTEAGLAVIRTDEGFDDVIAWLAQWRADASVETAYKRLMAGRLQ